MTFSAQNGLVAETIPASALVGEAKDIAEVLVCYRSADAASLPVRRGDDCGRSHHASTGQTDQMGYSCWPIGRTVPRSYSALPGLAS
jgi:hypothetical protein